MMGSWDANLFSQPDFAIVHALSAYGQWCSAK